MSRRSRRRIVTLELHQSEDEYAEPEDLQPQPPALIKAEPVKEEGLNGLSYQQQLSRPKQSVQSPQTEQQSTRHNSLAQEQEMDWRSDSSESDSSSSCSEGGEEVSYSYPCNKNLKEEREEREVLVVESGSDTDSEHEIESESKIWKYQNHHQKVRMKVKVKENP